MAKPAAAGGRRDDVVAELIRCYASSHTDPQSGARLLAWEGLEGPGEPSDQAELRALLDEAVGLIRTAQQDGQAAARFAPAVLLLMLLGAGNALVVYPQVARALFGGRAGSAEFAENYHAQLAALLGPEWREGPG